ncbi:hypothetical protein CBR_g53704, partial [Chara braunii]
AAREQPLCLGTANMDFESTINQNFAMRDGDHCISPELFRSFLKEDFNVTAFASGALGSGSAAQSSQKLTEGIELLERQLRNEVIARHDELLEQVTSLRDTENVVTVVRSGIDSLQASLQRVRSELAEPYKLIRTKTRQLAALHETMELLRQVIRVIRLIAKLRDLMTAGETGGHIDLAKAAQLFNEIETARREVNLSGVDVVDTELGWIAEAGQRIRTEAMKNLEDAMAALDQAEIGSILQVYFNMGELKQTVDLLINRYKQQATKAITSALDMKTISTSGSAIGPGGIQRSGTPSLGGGARARDALWQRLQACTDKICSIILAVWNLQRVMVKKRDPITHVCFIQEVVQPGDVMITDRVWEVTSKILSNQFKSAFTASSFVKETFVSGYPKLASIFNGMQDRISRESAIKGVPPALREEDKEQIMAAVEQFQQAYLAQSLSRMTDTVTSMFTAGVRSGSPTQEQMSRLVSRLTEELDAVKGNTKLTLLVTKSAAKALQLLAQKSEYQVVTGPDVRQVTGPATGAQIKNISLSLSLQDCHQRVSVIAANLPPPGTELLSASLGSIYGVASDAITPLFTAMVEMVESSILQMHDYSFGSDEVEVDTETGSSRYMQEVQEAITHYRSEFLSKLLQPVSLSFSSAASFQLKQCAEEGLGVGLVKRMAARVLLFFVRHAALVRPLSESGKLQMARDMAELELVVSQNLFPVEQLGAPYRALRAFRPLIFLETSQILGSPFLQELPPSVVLHHLYSRAPEELLSPHKQANLSPQQYSLWLDQHGEEDVWKGVKGTLDAYAAKVKSRGDKEFSQIYPLMMTLGGALTETASSQAKV